MKPKHLILDCDTKNEIDDQFAIVYALRSPEIKLEGVVSVQNDPASGPNSVDFFHKEARTILSLAESSVPCFRGSSRPIEGRLIERSEGVDFILHKAAELGPDLIIAGTGPATDLAQAWLQAPELMRRVQTLWIGGYVTNEDALTLGECNFFGDKTSAELLFSFDPGPVLIPASEVSDTLMLQKNKLVRRLRAEGSALYRYLADISEEKKEKFWVMWDIAVVAFAKGLGMKSIVERPACVVRDGHLVFPLSSEHRIQVVVDIDEFAILADFTGRLFPPSH